MLPCPRAARYSGSDRPAWRMNHTGTRSTVSPRHARMNGASSNRPSCDGTHSPVPGHASAGGRDGTDGSIPTGGTGPVVPRRFGYCSGDHGQSLGEGAEASTPAGPVAL